MKYNRLVAKLDIEVLLADKTAWLRCANNRNVALSKWVEEVLNDEVVRCDRYKPKRD